MPFLRTAATYVSQEKVGFRAASAFSLAAAMSSWTPSLQTSRTPQKMPSRGLLCFEFAWLGKDTFSRMTRLGLRRANLADL